MRLNAKVVLGLCLTVFMVAGMSCKNRKNRYSPAEISHMMDDGKPMPVEEDDKTMNDKLDHEHSVTWNARY